MPIVLAPVASVIFSGNGQDVSDTGSSAGVTSPTSPASPPQAADAADAAHTMREPINGGPATAAALPAAAASGGGRFGQAARLAALQRKQE